MTGHAARQPSRAERVRQGLLDDIATAVDDLIRQVRTTALHVRDKGPGADGRVRAAPTSETHRTRALGLVVQLKAAVNPSGGSGWDEDGALTPGRGGKPTSRPPLSVASVDQLAVIQAGTRHWRQRLGGRGRRPFVHELRGLVGLARTADDQQLRALRADLRSWVRTARISLAYDVPAVDLEDMVCPDCQGVLRVLADASSDVWCAGGPWPRCVVDYEPAPRQSDGDLLNLAVVRRGDRQWTPGCGATWPRGQWVLLLEQSELTGTAR